MADTVGQQHLPPPPTVTDIPQREVAPEFIQALSDAVAVMDAIRSEGGCSWAAQQTHASLARYAIEEAYELSAAIAEGSHEAIRDELGDVLMQVLFHARVAQDHAVGAFSLEDVARTWIAKMRRRRPHIFEGTSERDIEESHQVWQAARQAEHPGPRAPLHGVPRSMPPLEQAQLLANRCARDGIELPQASGDKAGECAWGERLFDVIHAAAADGVDVTVALQQAIDHRVQLLDHHGEPTAT